jgi:hypothetical protein
VLEDKSFGLRLKGYVLVPNDALESKIAIYTPEVVQSILSERPELVHSWLRKLHNEYIDKKKSCDFENDPIACFNLSAYEEFEKNFKSWEDGGIIAIALSQNRVIRISKRPLITITAYSNKKYLVCDKCFASFTDLEEFEKHCKYENGVKEAETKSVKRHDEVAPNPIWWISS